MDQGWTSHSCQLFNHADRAAWVSIHPNNDDTKPRHIAEASQRFFALNMAL